jgi:hypothetical protein
MISRTNRHSEGRHLGRPAEGPPAEHEPRRQLAVQRSLDGAPLAIIGPEMGGAKRWLSQWKTRSPATEPPWFQERSRRPAPPPAKTPEAREAHLIALRQAVAPAGSAPVSACGIREPRRPHPRASSPSLRPIYRSLNRQTTAGGRPSRARDQRQGTLAPRPLTRCARRKQPPC